MDIVTQTKNWLGNEDDADDDDFNPLNRQYVLIIGFVKFILSGSMLSVCLMLA